jgi:hypothetical protein
MGGLLDCFVVPPRKDELWLRRFFCFFNYLFWITFWILDLAFSILFKVLQLNDLIISS